MSKNEIEKKEVQVVKNLEKEVMKQLEKVKNDIPKSTQVDMLSLEYMEHFRSEAENNEKLASAINNNLSKFAVATTSAIILGLKPKKEFNLLPFGNSLEVHYDYKALIKLMINYSVIPIKMISYQSVRENDNVEFNNGNMKHTYNPFANLTERGKLIGAYAKIEHEDGTTNYVTVSADEVNKIKPKGSNNPYSPWVNFPDEMWGKTAIRKAQKFYPLDFGNQTLNNASQEIDKLDSPFSDNVIKVDYEEEETKQIENNHEVEEVIEGEFVEVDEQPKTKAELFAEIKELTEGKEDLKEFLKTSYDLSSVEGVTEAIQYVKDLDLQNMKEGK